MKTPLTPVPPWVLAPPPDEVAALTLAELVERFPMLARVRCVVLAARTNGIATADLTVSEFLSADSARLRAQTPNLGAKTIAYLHRYVVDLGVRYAQRNRCERGDSRPPPAERDPLDMPLVEFVSRHPIAKRVDNLVHRAAARGIEAAHAAVRCFQDCVDGGEALANAIPCLRLQAAEQLCLALCVFFARQDAARGVALLSPEAFLERAQRVLDGPCRTVFEHRAGILPRRTLNDLSQRLRVSVQQAHDLERRARCVMRAVATRYRAAAVLDAAFESWWPQLCEGGFSYAGDTPPHALLSHSALYLLAAAGRQEALRRHCEQVNGAWLLRKDLPADAAARAIDLERALRRDWAMPQPLETLLADFGLTRKEATILALHQPDLTIEQGYAFIGPTSRARRMARLDALLRGAPAPISGDQLVGAATDASAKELDRTLSEASHLMLRVWDRQWCSLQTLPRRLPAMRARLDGAHGEQGVSRRDSPRDRAAAAALRQCLLARGTASWSVVCDAVPALDAAAILRLLRTMPDVARGGPGIYCLRSELPRVAQASPTWFCNERQATIFALGRRAGLGERFFPLWSPAGERGVCEWARAAAPPALYRSLLSVAVPQQWPQLRPAELEFWRNEQSGAEFDLRARPDFGFVGRLAASRLLAMLIALRANGHISWLEANRCIGCTTDSRAGILALGLLAAMGAVLPNADWRKRHGVRADRVEHLLTPLVAPLRRTGKLPWAVIAELFDDDAVAAPWLRMEPVQGFVDQMRRREQAGAANASRQTPPTPAF